MLLIFRATCRDMLVICETLCLLAALAAVMSAAPQPSPSCFVELPVYGPDGELRKFSVRSVRTLETKTELLSATREEDRVVVGQDRIYLPQKWVRSALEVVLEGTDPMQRVPAPVRIKAIIEVAACEQRTTLRTGVMDSNRDIGVTSIAGRVTGCRIDHTWWVRALPMFGGHDRMSTYDGYIKADGSFQVVGMLQGERHIVIFGRGVLPLKVVAFNVTGNASNSVETVDVSDLCAKGSERTRSKR